MLRHLIPEALKDYCITKVGEGIELRRRADFVADKKIDVERSPEHKM